MALFIDGETYKTQCGKFVTVLNHSRSCIVCSDGRHRYDREYSSYDAGRVTGSNMDYSHPDNIDRVAAGLPTHEEEIAALDKELKESPAAKKFGEDLTKAILRVTQEKEESTP